MPQSTRKSSNKKRVSIILSLTFLVGLGIYAYQTLPQILFAAPASDPALMVPDVAVPSSDLVMPHKKTKAKTMTDIDMMVNELSDRLRRQFAENIHLLAIQVSLRNLRDDLNRSYPAQGQALFVRILKLAFPEFVDAIIKAIALMDEYDVWLQGMLLSLNDMNPLEQQGVLWEKRRALFGDAAIQIWQEEISAEQERQITMRNTMEILDKAYDTQMQERLYLLQSTFEETYLKCFLVLIQCKETWLHCPRKRGKLKLMKSVNPWAFQKSKLSIYQSLIKNVKNVGRKVMPIWKRVQLPKFSILVKPWNMS